MILYWRVLARKVIKGDCHGRHPASKERLLKQDAFPRKDKLIMHRLGGVGAAAAEEGWDYAPASGVPSALLWTGSAAAAGGGEWFPSPCPLPSGERVLYKLDHIKL